MFPPCTLRTGGWGLLLKTQWKQNGLASRENVSGFRKRQLSPPAPAACGPGRAPGCQGPGGLRVPHPLEKAYGYFEQVACNRHSTCCHSQGYGHQVPFVFQIQNRDLESWQEPGVCFVLFLYFTGNHGTESSMVCASQDWNSVFPIPALVCSLPSGASPVPAVARG